MYFVCVFQCLCQHLSFSIHLFLSPSPTIGCYSLNVRLPNIFDVAADLFCLFVYAFGSHIVVCFCFAFLQSNRITKKIDELRLNESNEWMGSFKCICSSVQHLFNPNIFIRNVLDRLKYWNFAIFTSNWYEFVYCYIHNVLAFSITLKRKLTQNKCNERVKLTNERNEPKSKLKAKCNHPH